MFETSPISKLACIWPEIPRPKTLTQILKNLILNPLVKTPQLHLPKNPYMNPLELSPQKKPEVCIPPLNYNKPDLINPNGSSMMNGGVQNPEVKSMEVISRLKVMPKGQIVQGAKSAFRTFWRIGSRGCAIRPTPPFTQHFLKHFVNF